MEKIFLPEFGIFPASLCEWRDPTEQIVITWMWNYSNTNQWSTPTQQILCDLCGISKATVNRVLAKLESEGLIVRKNSKTSDDKVSNWDLKNWFDNEDVLDTRTCGINDNILYNNNIISLEREGVGEKTFHSYAEKEKQTTLVPESSRADALKDSWDKTAKIENALEKTLVYWNSVFKKNYQITPQLKTAWKAAWKKYGSEWIKTAIYNYVKYVSENSWYTHRFSPYEFVKQANWIPKYLNM